MPSHADLRSMGIASGDVVSISCEVNFNAKSEEAVAAEFAADVLCGCEVQ